MNPKDLLNQVKELIEKKDFSAAQDLITENKQNLGEYFEQAKGLIESAGGIDGVLDKAKGLVEDSTAGGIDGVLDKVKGLFGK